MRLPSYMSSSTPWAYNLTPPEDVWTNRERGLVYVTYRFSPLNASQCC